MTGQMSLRTRLLTGLLASLTLVLAAACIALYWSEESTLQAQFDRHLEQQANAATREFSPRPPASTQESISSDALAGLSFIAIVDAANGTVERVLPAGAEVNSVLPRPLTPLPEVTLFHTCPAPAGVELRVLMRRMGPPRLPNEPGPDRPRGSVRPAGPPSMDGPATRPFFGPRDGGGPPRPGFGPDRWREPRVERVLVAAADLAPLRASMRQWAMLLASGGAVGELLVIAVVFLAVQRGLRPLRVLESDIARIDHSDLDQRVETENLPGEVRPLVAQINALLSRLGDAFARERSFTASAAHEFRTPLAGIRTQIEVCLQRVRTPGEYQAKLNQCLAGTITLQRMVDALLQLASLDAGLRPPAQEHVDLAALVKSRWADLEPIAADRGCRSKLDVPESLDCMTDPAMLEHVVSNLLGNAAEYADAGGSIEIALDAPDGQVRLSVTNPASSLDVADVPKLFDRFWRKDASRSGGNHTGLGLAIAARCVESLGGRIDADLRDASLRMTVTVPVGSGK